MGCEERRAVQQEASELQSESILIGGVSPLTGAQATYGASVSNGIGLAIREVNARGGVISVDEAMPIVLQVLEGLEYAHNVEVPGVLLSDGSTGKAVGLVHRDLKPGNIFLARAGEKPLTPDPSPLEYKGGGGKNRRPATP